MEETDNQPSVRGGSLGSTRMELRIPVASLRCPRTGAPLVIDNGFLTTLDRRQRYPVVDGVPVLVDPGLSLFNLDDVKRSVAERAAPRSATRRILRTVIPSPRRSLALGSTERYERFERLVSESPLSTPQRC